MGTGERPIKKINKGKKREEREIALFLSSAFLFLNRIPPSPDLLFPTPDGPLIGIRRRRICHLRQSNGRRWSAKPKEQTGESLFPEIRRPAGLKSTATSPHREKGKAPISYVRPARPKEAVRLPFSGEDPRKNLGENLGNRRRFPEQSAPKPKEGERGLFLKLNFPRVWP